MTISTFQGEHRFLSNFYPAEVVLDGITYPTTEHAFQAAKFEDASLRRQIRAAATPGRAKRAAREFPGRRVDWDEVKIGVMEGLLRQKFSQPDFTEMLLRTGDQELVEGNTWGDVFWGVCRGVGENNLGKILMKIRGDLQASGQSK